MNIKYLIMLTTALFSFSAHANDAVTIYANVKVQIDMLNGIARSTPQGQVDFSESDKRAACYIIGSLKTAARAGSDHFINDVNSFHISGCDANTLSEALLDIGLTTEFMGNIYCVATTSNNFTMKGYWDKIASDEINQAIGCASSMLNANTANQK